MDNTRIGTCTFGALTEGDCGAYGATCSESGGAAHCVHYMCSANLDGGENGKFCVDDTRVATCEEGTYSEGDCAAYGATCSNAGGSGHCVHFMCSANLDGGEEGTFCTDESTVGSCTLGTYTETACGGAGQVCISDGNGARCDSPATTPEDPTPPPPEEEDPAEPTAPPPGGSDPSQDPPPASDADAQDVRPLVIDSPATEDATGCGGCSSTSTDGALLSFFALGTAFSLRRRRRNLAW
jgi:MYXO-CTERM domain-containing protein